MSDARYEGLNLAQLFELLHDVVPPEPVSWWPQTPGWWVLLAWLIVLSGLVSIKAVRRWRRNRYRREALAMLDQVDLAAPAAATDIARIVKRTALAVYERSHVASLYGADWAAFLVRSAQQDTIVAEGASGLAQAAWSEDIEAADIAAAARQWVRVHRA